jgi:cytochrome o ubiquinol oxidase subunit 3
MSRAPAPFTSSQAALRARPRDPYQLGHGRHGTPHGDDQHREPTGHGEGGPASKRIVVAYGFWIYLLSDIVMFSGFFAAYAVLSGEKAGGPGQRDLFELGRVGMETACLLLSSFTAGLSAIAVERRRMMPAQLWMLVTGLLGFAFLVLELQEFAQMIARGAGPQRSAFLSSFFALVGLHGLHVGVGLLWLGTIMAQLWVKGFRTPILRRIACFNLFWHALDIIWVAIFTIVYLMGVTQ